MLVSIHSEMSQVSWKTEAERSAKPETLPGFNMFSPTGLGWPSFGVASAPESILTVGDIPEIENNIK